MMTSPFRAVVAGALLCLCASAATARQQPPFRVFVYGSDARDNGYNGGCTGFAWQSAGFLTARGQPLAINADGDIVDADQNVVGARIRFGGQNVGWYNETTNTAIVNLTRGTVANAFALFDNADYGNQTEGTLQIMRHGLTRQVRVRDPDNRNRYVRTQGGGIYLDAPNERARLYAGFDAGTGIPQTPAYQVAGPEGASIALRLYSCFSGIPVDLPGISVQRSAMNLTGVSEVWGMQANDPVAGVPVVRTLAIPDVDIITRPANVTEQQVRTWLATQYTLWGAAFKDQNYLAGVRFQRHWDVIRNKPTNFTAPFGQFQVRWKIRYTADSALERGSSGDGFNQDFPINVQRDQFGEVRGLLDHTPPDGTGLRSSVELAVSSFSAPDPDSITLHLGRLLDLDELGAPSPVADKHLATGLYDLATFDAEVFGCSGTWRLDILPDSDLSTLQIFRYENSSWIEMPFTLDPSSGQYAAAIVDFSNIAFSSGEHGFIIGGFAVPGPSGGALLLITIALAGRRRRARLGVSLHIR